MKTEKEFSDFFIAACQCENDADNNLYQLAAKYWIDLTAHLNTYFSYEDRLSITQMAAEKLMQNLRGQHYTRNTAKAWVLVVRDFIENNNWGFKSINKKPDVKETEEQKIFWHLFKYVWAFFQSMIVLKIAVYYFGLESAEHPDQTNVLWVIFFFGLSAGSLAFFAYRNRHDKG